MTILGRHPSQGSAGPDAVATSLCIVVPTRNERGNVAPLLARLHDVLPGEHVEVLFVDDSEDGTAEEVERAAASCRHRVAVMHRPDAERWGGLGGAVVDGIRACAAPWICVMDGDLQHPPEVIADLWARAHGTGADVVVATRYAAGPLEGLGAVRRAVSRAATTAARAVLPRRMRAVTDPLSGFFMVRRSALHLDLLRPAGFKILLEILSRTPGLRTAEVPYAFGARAAGRSKASVREGLRYLAQLWRLRLGDLSARFTRFGLVGLSGLLVNTLVLAGLTGDLGMWYVVSAVIATQASTLWNFCLTESWVFGGRRFHLGAGRRFGGFWVMNNTALLLRAPILVVLTSAVGINYLVSNLVSLLALTLMRFGVSDAVIWAETPQRPTHRYSVHGIVSVESPVALPELARFEVERLSGPPTITVRIGRPRRPSRTPGEPAGRSVHYREIAGPLGFAARIDAGGPIRVVASPLVGRSAHVLYTNLVEPILRWALVSRGYALVHAACVAAGDEAFLVTARTDTGKTTTVLLALRGGGWRFLSDDLTLVSADGRLLCFPKPLTISRHTLHAVGTADLSRRERLGLRVQSHVHSRSGRRAALSLARHRVPAATLNAIVQILVPPPKYHVERLVPGVQVARDASLAGMVVIERGTPDQRRLSGREALSTLLANCDDAYTFPPYASIAPFLRGHDGRDLVARERRIIQSALAGLPATLLVSDRMDWAERLPEVVQAGLAGERRPTRARAHRPGRAPVAQETAVPVAARAALGEVV